jgi:rare lipoprotein A
MNTAKQLTFFILFLFNIGFATAQTDSSKIYKGVASFYAKKFEGRKTANGEKFSNYDMTCAHRKFKFNTMLKVTNKKNGLSTIVRVNDRGPYVKGRIVDLSEQAARMIGKYQKGLAAVTIEIIQPLATTEMIDSIFKNEKVIDCLGNKSQLNNYTISLWRTKDMQHAMLLANHLYLSQDVHSILIGTKGTGKEKRYHLLITNIETKEEVARVKDLWERKGFMRVTIFE